MSKRSPFPGTALFCWLAFLPAMRAGAEPSAERPAPVLLELFTSQGCSTCPAADELLSRLGLDPSTRGLVIPLAFHVDYWSGVGWIDPFSERAWTLRQDAYRRALDLQDGVYTPQLVVNGQVELVGSDVRRVQEEINAALRRPAAASVRLQARPAEGRKPALAVDVEAEVLDDAGSRKLELFVAVFENSLLTRVGRGENGGRTLRNDFIVRRLERAFAMEPGRARQGRELTLKLDGDWKAENLGVAAFLQDPRSMRILAAAAQDMAPAAGGRP